MRTPFFSERKPSIKQVLLEILPRNKPTWTELNRGLQRLSLETESSTEFSRVKPRIDKLNPEIKQG